jgi:hypothetical protein
VETIGDSFMCVSGMLPARADHGRAALRLALDMHAAAAGVDLGDGRHLHVRVGLHSGAITTGVSASAALCAAAALLALRCSDAPSVSALQSATCARASASLATLSM